jgi:hypothetical protein
MTESGIFMVPIDVSLRKALALIVNKLPPSAIAEIFEQLMNALSPIVRILPAIVNVLVMLLQFWNTEDPMVLTLSGMLIVPNDVLFSNALLSINNKFPPSATAGSFEQPLNA